MGIETKTVIGEPCSLMGRIQKHLSGERAKKVELVREKIRARSRLRGKTMVNPPPVPRFDADFYEFTEWLDTQ